MNILSGINKKLINYILIAVGVVVGIFVLIFILSLFKVKTYSTSEIEEELKRAAISYYDENKASLPQNEGETVVVDDVTLSEAGKMKKLSKMTKKGTECTGIVTVQKSGSYYLYTPNLDCGESYKTTGLTAKIKENNPVTTKGDGLYQIGDSLVFRGEKVNNFVSFSGKVWRIIRINDDNSLRLVQNDIVYTGLWDDRYNINREETSGINDFEISRIKDGLDKIYYELDMFNDSAKEKMVFKYLCIGKRNEEATDNSGNIECSTLTSEAKPIGLLQTNEFMLASLDPNCVHTYDEQCANYNYMSTLQKTTWTLNADSSNTYKAYKFYGNSYSPSTCSSETGLRLVINLSSNLSYLGGNGSEEDPYIVK